MLIRSVVYSFFFFFSSRRRHTRFDCDWSSDVCSSDLHFFEHLRPGVQRAQDDERVWVSLCGEPPGERAIATSSSFNHSEEDRKSTRLNSSHSQISYAVFCLKKKKKQSRR